MKIFRKQTIRWRVKGQNVRPGTKGAKRHVIESKRFYGTLLTSDGKRKQIPLTEDADTSTTTLRRLQHEEDTFRAAGVDRSARERLRPLSDLVAAYESELRSRGNTDFHVSVTMKRIRAVFADVKAKTLADVDAAKIAQTLTKWRERKRKPLSQASSNHYVRAVKGFSRWLWQSKRTNDDVLVSLRLVNVTHRKRKRRAMTQAELGSLLKKTEASDVTLCGLSPVDRAWLYRIAAFTGLRASELASLTPASFDLVAKTVSVDAAYSKRRRNDVLPLHCSIVDRIGPWIAAKTGTLWRGTWTGCRCANSARMLRRDLKRAGIADVDASGRVVDFHALRHTFISSLARNGVHPLKAKSLARHSTITLTMDVYSHVETDELRDALNAIPAT